jgi:hypothetical protein
MAGGRPFFRNPRTRHDMVTESYVIQKCVEHLSIEHVETMATTLQKPKHETRAMEEERSENNHLTVPQQIFLLRKRRN